MILLNKTLVKYFGLRVTFYGMNTSKVYAINYIEPKMLAKRFLKTFQQKILAFRITSDLTVIDNTPKQW